jgi:hypothetical protein
MGRDNQAAVTKSVLHKVTVVVSLSHSVCRCRYTHTHTCTTTENNNEKGNQPCRCRYTHTRIHTSKISTECKWLQCMSRLVADSTESSNDSMFIVMPPAHSNVRYIIFKAQRIEPILHAETNPAGPGSKSVLFK